MKSLIIIGIILIIVGAIGLIYGGITYTTKKDAIDFGGIEFQINERERIDMPPILGGIAMAVGVGLVFIGRKGKSRE